MNSKRDNGLYNWYPPEKPHRQTLMSQTSSLNTIIILIAGKIPIIISLSIINQCMLITISTIHRDHQPQPLHRIRAPCRHHCIYRSSAMRWLYKCVGQSLDLTWQKKHLEGFDVGDIMVALVGIVVHLSTDPQDADFSKLSSPNCE